MDGVGEGRTWAGRWEAEVERRGVEGPAGAVLMLAGAGGGGGPC